MKRILVVFFLFLTHTICRSDSPNVPMTREPSYTTKGDSNDCINVSKNCSELSNLCLECPTYNPTLDCRYGEWLNVTCSAPAHLNCKNGKNNIIKKARCVYCYQTEKWEQTCVLKNSCTAVQTPPYYYKTNCTVHDDVMCLGNRKFSKKLRCNWTRGHKWSTALLLSITLGGFGADRFYLGHWQEGIGKLFSFGGLGVWTLVDVLLIAIRYLGPADGSFYV